MRRQIFPALAALVLTVSTAHAQVIRGVVAEDPSATPVEGAMVVLQELDGTVVRRVLTDGSGGFVTRADHPGAYRIRVDRIGYESLTTQRFDVPVEGTFQRVGVPIRPVELMGLDVEGSRRCQLRAEQGQATARAWEEARKALEAAAWTLASGAYRYTLLQFERTLDRNARSPKNETRRFVRATGQAPYVSLPAERLVEDGFIRRNPDRTLTYFAPDAGSFLSDVFLDTHCMRLQEVKDGRVGLAFEPVKGRRMPDIEGTLWIEAATATLERLEFTYVNVPGDRVGSPGGQVTFGHLPNGTWIVREWSIRMPILQTNMERTNTTLRGYQEQGGVVWRVSDREGSIVVEAATASVSGTVVDSAGARPLPGVLIWTDDGGEPVTTEGAGTFLLSGLPPGLQVVQAQHPSLDSLGLGPVEIPVDASAGDVTSVQVRIPGVGEMVGGACSLGPDQEQETTSLLGWVRSGKVAAAGARVRIRWLGGSRRGFEVTDRAAPDRTDLPALRWTQDPDDDPWLFTTLDDRGIFILCGIPTGSQVRVEVAFGDEPPAVHTATLPHGARLVTLPIVLKERSQS